MKPIPNGICYWQTMIFMVLFFSELNAAYGVDNRMERTNLLSGGSGKGINSPNGVTIEASVEHFLFDDSCKIKLEKKTEKIYQDGIDYLKKGNYNLAGQQMRKVVSDEPGCVDAYFVLGIVNFKKTDNNFREAEKNFTKVIELCPSYDVYAYYYLGEIYYGQ